MEWTGIAAVDWFLGLLDAWGYLIVAGFTIFENIFIVGSFTPGETVVIAAAAVSSKGHLLLWGVWASSVIGTIVGSNLSYWGGRAAGIEGVRGVIERLAVTRTGKILRIDPAGIEEIRHHFHTDGARTVLIARFAIGVKNWVPAMAGAMHMPVRWFQLYTVIGAVLYTSLMCAIGWFLAENFDRALSVASGVGWAGLGIMALFVGAIWLGRKRYKKTHEVHHDEHT